MADIKLHAIRREAIGKNRVDKLRENKQVPAIMYGRGKDNLVLQLDVKELEKAYDQAGTSTIVDLIVDGETYPGLFKEVQKHPYKNQFLHVDFHAINMDEVIRLLIPLTIVGRENIEVDGPFVFVQGVTEIEIECLPGDIPETVECDVSELTFDTPIFIEDLDVFKSEKITVLTDPEETVASLSVPEEEPAEDEELGEEEVSAADVPVIGEDEEGEESEEEE